LLASALDVSAYVRRTSLLVDLDGGLVVLDTNDLSYEVVVTNTDLDLSVVPPASA
jgi:hypothetical protein